MKKLNAGLTFYKDKRGEWRWRVVAKNGRILGVSSESYKRRIDCVQGAHGTMAGIQDSGI
jgi:uncharacterized protein YegP (UPF0339 family)